MTTASATTARAHLTEDQVRSAVATANVPALLMLVFQVTGDEKWLAEPYRPTRGKGLGDHDSGGLPASVQQEIREAAVQAILDLQKGVSPSIEYPSPDLAPRMMSVCMGEPVGEEYGPLLHEELARRINPDAPELKLPEARVPEGFKVVVVGAGLAGVVAAHSLEEMGVDYTIIERQDGPGGNWLENTYPGCGVDTPSHLYSYSFAKKDWTRHFELRDEIQAYFAEVLTALGADRRVRYRTEVVKAEYDEGAMRWRVEVRGPGGMETLEADVLISAAGVLNNPRIPDIPGVGTFGQWEFHSSHWPNALDLKGKRVAVVGNGASAMQIVPAIAGEVEQLTIFQRSKQWAAPFEKFQVPISPELRLLIGACPIYFAWYWARLFWQFGDKVIEALRVDPDWPHPERSVNARNDAHRAYFTRYIESYLADRPDLMAQVVPDYPPFGKRILLDNGWYETLKRDNVTLVSEGVAAVKPGTVVTTAGQEFAGFDVLVWATGFHASRFLASLNIIGRGGVTLRQEWDDDNPRAYLGLAVPGFPNFFMLGGPNTFPGSGSFTFFNEVQMRYIRLLLTAMFNRSIDELEVRREVFEAYNERVDELHARTVWTHPGMSTFFRNERGRVTFLNPFLNVEFWRMTREVDLSEYHTGVRDAASPP